MGGLSNLFVNPALLLGGLAVLAPIIIWLLTRFRYRKVDWAALIFLQRALKKQQRRLRLENLLLLIIRCLLILLFALALARPRYVGQVVTNEEDASKNIVLLIDTSYSTSYQVGSDEEETVFKRTLRTAKDIVASLEEGDRVNVVAFDEEVRPLYQKPRQLNERVKEEILQDLEDAPEVQLSQRGTDLAGALHALPRILRAFDFDASGRPPPEGAAPLEKAIILLSDAQRLDLLDADGELLDRTLLGKAEDIKNLGGVVSLIDCGAEEPKNASVTHLASREPVVGRDLPCHVEAIVKNWSAVELTDLTVEYFVDGAQTPQKTVSLTIPAGEELTPEPLRYVFHEAGLHTVQVQLKSDALTLDNQRQFVVDVRDHVRVLLVDGERSRERWMSESDFVYEVLALSEFPGEDGLGLLHPEVTDESQLSGRKLDEFDAIILSNVASLDDESTAALERYTRNGGATIFTMGGLVDAQAYNDGMWRQGLGIFPCKLLEIRGGTRAEAQADENAPEWVMTLGDWEDHIVSVFKAEEMKSWLRLPSIFGFQTVEIATPSEESGATPGGGLWIPLRAIPRPADDALDEPTPEAETLTGQPLLVEKVFGRGRVVAWLSTVDHAWNNCVLYDGFYLPFWRQLVLDLAQRTRPALNLPIGGRYERLLRADEYAARIEVESPDGRRESITLARVGEQELYRLVYPEDDERGGVQESGLYTITRKGVAGAAEEPPPDFFAVSIDTQEGDLTKYSAEELQEALGIPVELTRPEGARDALRTEGGVGGSREYWREVLMAVIVLLALESLLAALFGRKRR